ncbi:MAG: nicotinate (nicotinamide) nucleotide adenylyltransferase [Edaphocola sp.]
MNIGLYFGSFNPIHTGHLIIANHVLEHTDLDKIWFVVSPHNPLKESHTLLNEYDRLHLVELAIKDNNKFRASNIEFHLPKPSYTIDTLTYLTEKFPLEKFTVIMGSDSYVNLPRWKNHEKILELYKLVVYQRPDFPVDAKALPPNVATLQAPLLQISSTYIRQQVKEGKSIRYLVADDVAAVIADNRYYLK